LLQQEFADALAQIALQFHGAVAGCSAGAARALQLLAQRLEEHPVARETVDDRDGLAAASLLLDSKLCDDPRGDRLRGGVRAALAVVDGPAAARTDSAAASRVHRAGVAVRHRAIIRGIVTTRIAMNFSGTAAAIVFATTALSAQTQPRPVTLVAQVRAAITAHD